MNSTAKNNDLNRYVNLCVQIYNFTCKYIQV